MIARLIALSSILSICSVVSGQSFNDDFSGPPAANFAASSSNWDAVWSQDGWTTAINAGGVSPNTDADGPGKFGSPADAFENAIVAGDQSWRDYAIETEFYVNDDDAVGIVFRYTSPSNFYVMVMSRDSMPGLNGIVEHLLQPQTRIYRVTDEAIVQLPSSPAQTAYLQDPLALQRLRVEVDRTSIRVWLASGDDEIDPTTEPTISVDDEGTSLPTNGRAGLYAFDMGEATVGGTFFASFRVESIDSDKDGKSNDQEYEAGTNPHDADSDDDGVIDGDEFAWDQDFDGDGLINALDWDADNDGLPDGLERGVTKANADTNMSAGHFKADEDPTTTTNPLDSDSDNGGVKDGDEDLNGNGRYEPKLGETDPNDGDDDVERKDGGVDVDTDLDTDSDRDTDNGAGAGANLGSLSGGPDCDCSAVGALGAARLLILP